MTVRDFIINLARCGGTYMEVVPKSIVSDEILLPKLNEHLQILYKKMHYDGLDLNADRSEYSFILESEHFFESVIKPAMLECLEECAPQAWFKPVFFSKEQQKEMGMPV